MRIKPKCGYWQTSSFPIGGDFRRAGTEGVKVVEIIRDIEPPCHGCSLEVRLESGKTAAVASNCFAMTE